MSEEVPAAHEDIAEIEDLLARFGEAVSRGDVDTIRQSYCEDAVCVFTGKTGRVRGTDEITDVWRRHVAAWTDVKLTRSDTAVRIHGDTAWATFLWSGAGTADGKRYAVPEERWSAVLLWEDGAWRFAQTHSSLPYTDWDRLEVTG